VSATFTQANLENQTTTKSFDIRNRNVMAASSTNMASLRTNIYPAIDPASFTGALKGKVALVTGSGRGIGKEIAKALANCGASVCVTGRTQSEVEQATKEVLEAGRSNVKVIGVPADGLKRDDLEMLVKKVRR